MDFKPFSIYIGAIFIGQFDEVLKTGALALNLGYLGYQFWVFHKKNKK